MPLPLLAGAAVLGGGQLVNGISNFFGEDAARRAKERAIEQAKGEVSKGYGDALNLANPFAATANQGFNNLAGDVSGGKFDLGRQAPVSGGSFNYNPNQVFNDPEYKAQMAAGTRAVEGANNGSGQLFGGKNLIDLQKLGNETFANRSDDLYGRARGAFETDRGFGLNAQNSANSFNLASNGQQLGAEQNVAGYAPGANATAEGLYTGQAQNLANLSIGKGTAQAEGILGQANAIGNTAINLAGTGASGYLNQNMLDSVGGDYAKYFKLLNPDSTPSANGGT